MSIGKRLREERERLGLSQPKFAAIAETTKQTLFSWESEKTAPDGFQLAALAAGGVDVLYVLTGQFAGGVQPAPSLSPKEQVVIDLFRKASEEKQNTVLGALLGAPLDPGGVRDVNMTNRAHGGVQIGILMGGKTTVRKKGRNKPTTG